MLLKYITLGLDSSCVGVTSSEKKKKKIKKNDKLRNVLT